MNKENKIFSIGFEGMHQAGKGTQIELLKQKLKEKGIPCVSIRGEGYRQGSGASPDDPKSDFWKKMGEQLKRGGDLNLWNEASYRLARELIVWRDRILSKEIDKVLAPFGVLLIDRCLISNAILKSLQMKPPPEKIFSSEELYPKLFQKHKKITTDMVLPDIIFELVAPKDTLLSRLDTKDSNYTFKKKNIEDKYKLYMNAKQHLPEEIQKIIVTIDSSTEPDEIYKKITDKLKLKLPKLEL